MHEVKCINVMLGHNAQNSRGTVHGCSGEEIRSLNLIVTVHRTWVKYCYKKEFDEQPDEE